LCIKLVIWKSLYLCEWLRWSTVSPIPGLVYRNAKSYWNMSCRLTAVNFQLGCSWRWICKLSGILEALRFKMKCIHIAGIHQTVPQDAGHGLFKSVVSHHDELNVVTLILAKFFLSSENPFFNKVICLQL